MVSRFLSCFVGDFQNPQSIIKCVVCSQHYHKFWTFCFIGCFLNPRSICLFQEVVVLKQCIEDDFNMVSKSNVFVSIYFVLVWRVWYFCSFKNMFLHVFVMFHIGLLQAACKFLSCLLHVSSMFISCLCHVSLVLYNKFLHFFHSCFQYFDVL